MRRIIERIAKALREWNRKQAANKPKPQPETIPDPVPEPAPAIETGLIIEEVNNEEGYVLLNIVRRK